MGYSETEMHPVLCPIPGMYSMPHPGPGMHPVPHPSPTTHLDQLGQVVQQLGVGDGVDPPHGCPPHLLVREPAARTGVMGTASSASSPMGRAAVPEPASRWHPVAYVACRSPRASWWLMDVHWLSRA